MGKPTAIYTGWAHPKALRESQLVLNVLLEDFEVRWAFHTLDGQDIDQEHLSRNYLIDFIFNFGPTIFKKPLLTAPNIAAINFHTGPPRWPGRGGCSHAIRLGDKKFGITAHLMTEEIDAGEILHVMHFPILPSETAESLHRSALAQIPELALQTVNGLYSSGWELKPSGERWERTALRQVDLLPCMQINCCDSIEEIDRKIRAFTYEGKPGPYVELDGHLFRYEAQKR